MKKGVEDSRTRVTDASKLFGPNILTCMKSCQTQVIFANLGICGRDVARRSPNMSLAELHQKHWFLSKHWICASS